MPDPEHNPTNVAAKATLPPKTHDQSLGLDALRPPPDADTKYFNSAEKPIKGELTGAGELRVRRAVIRGHFVNGLPDCTKGKTVLIVYPSEKDNKATYAGTVTTSSRVLEGSNGRSSVKISDDAFIVPDGKGTMKYGGSSKPMPIAPGFKAYGLVQQGTFSLGEFKSGTQSYYLEAPRWEGDSVKWRNFNLVIEQGSKFSGRNMLEGTRIIRDDPSSPNPKVRGIQSIEYGRFENGLLQGSATAIRAKQDVEGVYYSLERGEFKDGILVNGHFQRYHGFEAAHRMNQYMVEDQISPIAGKDPKTGEYMSFRNISFTGGFTAEEIDRRLAEAGFPTLPPYQKLHQERSSKTRK